MKPVVSIQRAALGARVRAGRAVLGWSQSELARRIGSNQRSVNRIELGTVDARSSTIAAINKAFREAGIAFEDWGDDGFKLCVPSTIFAGDDD